MARYRKVDSRIWNDAKFRALSDNGKLAFFMLLTHPNMTALGGMRTTVSGLAEELGWPTEAFREAFREVLQKGMAKQDERACLVVLPHFLRYNQPESPNVVKAWAHSLDLLPECSLKSELIEQVKGYVEGLSEAFREALPKAFAKSMPYQEQEQEQEQEKEKDSATCVARPDDVDREPSAYTADQHIPPVGLTETQLNTKPKNISSNAAHSRVEEVWDYYREKLKRSPHLEFTKQRRTMGKDGLELCEAMARTKGSIKPSEDAVAMMKFAIDRLAGSPWHNGENERGAKYLDWEVLFRGRNVPSPLKLGDFWLNDEKWGAA